MPLHENERILYPYVSENRRDKTFLIIFLEKKKREIISHPSYSDEEREWWFFKWGKFYSSLCPYMQRPETFYQLNDGRYCTYMNLKPHVSFRVDEFWGRAGFRDEFRIYVKY